jgi:2-keto-4-pentenoate hydratase
MEPESISRSSNSVPFLNSPIAIPQFHFSISQLPNFPITQFLMTDHDVHAAADALWRKWQESRRIRELPAEYRPANRAEGYAIQAKLAELSGQDLAGWKIAATSKAGQAHIQVDGPLAGRLLEKRVLASGASVSLTGNLMRVAEGEFAFRMGADLRSRQEPYSMAEVLAAVASMHPAIEVPDSRYDDFTIVGAPQLIADNACACWFILGDATDVNWRELDLARHRVDAYHNGRLTASGCGANVLGDPRIALTWIANELTQFGDGLLEGQIVTTGTCITPVQVEPGDHVRVDLGVFGCVDVRFT